MAEYIIPSGYEGKMVAAEKLVRCRDCKTWSTGVAYSAVGKCKHPDHKGQITNRNFYCGDAEDKDD